MAAKGVHQLQENRDRLFSEDKEGQEDNGPRLQEGKGEITIRCQGKNLTFYKKGGHALEQVALL